MFLIAVACVFKGPSYLLGLPRKRWIFLTGLTLTSIVTSPIFVTNLNEVFLFFKVRYRIVDGKNPKLDQKLANAIGSLCTLFYYSSPIVVRAIGAWIY